MDRAPDERRSRLRRLDDLLDALEALNLRDSRAVPDRLAERLRQEGITDPEARSIRDLIENVLRVEKEFMIKLPDDRRVAGRRTPVPSFQAWLDRTR